MNYVCVIHQMVHLNSLSTRHSPLSFYVIHSAEEKLSRVSQKEMKCTASHTEIRGGLL